MQSERDKFLSQIAALHAEHEGAALRTELEQIKAADTPSLDKKVRGQIFRIKYKVHIRTASIIAACLVLVLMLPQVLWQMQPSRGIATAPAPAPAAPAAMPEAAMAMPDAAMDWDDDLAEPRVGGAGEPFGVYSGEAAPAAQEEEPTVGEVAYDVTDVVEWYASPFLFNLPDGFHLLSSPRRGLAEGDLFITYELMYGQDQMITLILQHGQALRTADDYSLNAMQVNGHTVHYQQSVAHGVSIHFEKDSAFYRLHSWDAELETLITLSQAILDS